jgi:putative oxidoreductase
MQEAEMRLGLAFLRATVGGLFMGHGLQKLTGWFGGGGLEQTGEFFESKLEMSPGRVHAAAAGAAETGGGALIAAGLATPLGASLLTGTMLTAIRKVHARNGVWVTKQGYEYNLVLIAIVFALSDVGPGRWSLDEALGTRRAGPRWALGQLLAGALGSAAAIELGRRFSEPTATDQGVVAAPQAGLQPVPENGREDVPKAA